MAPTQPLELDLSKCFKGEQQLVTWDIAYRALCDPKTASKSHVLREFLESNENRQILSNPWKPFPGPSPQAKQKFESKTAPISVTPSTNGHYNLDEIKEDALWLSNEAKISEYTALCLVIQEWQSRPTIQLLSGLTEEEALSVQDAAGLANLGASTFVPNSSILATPRTNPQFDSSDQRRLRIINVYHSTCASILRVSQMLVSWGAAQSLRSQTTYGMDYHTVCDSWIEDLGQGIATAQNNGPATISNARALDGCLGALKERMEALESPYGWNVSESILEAAAERWVTAQTTDLLHILHLALAHADLITKGLVAAATIEDWLNFFASRGFFRDFPATCADQEPLVPVIQLLTSLVSLALLKVDLVLRDIETMRVEDWDPAAYVLNSGIVSNITVLFGDMTASLGPSPASAPAFAWAVLSFRLTSRAGAEEAEREQLLENGSRASLGGASPLDESALAITRLETHEIFNNTMPFQMLAEMCSAAGVLGTINQLVDIGMSAFGTSVDRLSRDRLRILFLQLLRAALGSGIVEYSPELIVSTHTILAGDRTFRNWTDQDSLLHADPVVAYFLEDEQILRSQLLSEACFRYPYEMTPFLKFFSALTRGDKTIRDGVPTFVDHLRRTNKFMQRLPDGFKDFALIREEENANWVELTVNLPQFSSGTTSSFRGQRRLLTSASSLFVDGSLEIPAGTEGVIVDDRAPPYVAVWSYEHSALSYLVHLISTYPVGSNKVEYTSQQPASIENALEIIGLFADLLHSSLQASTGICSKDLLEAMDIGAERNQDTATIILSIFEEELLRLCQEPTNEGSLELLVNCTHFLEALIVIAPNRVWPWIARSRLLEGEGNGGSLATILIGTEMVLGRYDFLIGCIRLYKALVADAVDRSVARKGPSKALTRFNSPTTSDSGTSDKILSTILFKFGRTLASVYESSLSWKYTRLEHRPEINIGICEVFATILDLAYGTDDAPQLSSKLTKLIAPTAEYISELYLTKSENDLPTNPILASLVLGADSDHPLLLTSSAALWKHQTRSTLAFADILVRVAMLLGKPWTHLEQQLFKATPLLARLYASSDKWKSPVVLLLQSLVRGALRVVQTENPDKTGNSSRKTSDGQEPPSLLGHLGPRTAKNFLSVLSELDEPLGIVDIQTNVWTLLSAVVTCKQQWFSLYLLTGSTPRETLRTKSNPGAPASRNKALLSRALEALSALDLPPPGNNTGFAWPLYTAMLEFVSSAQNNWSWAMGDIRQHKDFTKQLLAFLKWMAVQPKNIKTNADVLERTYQNRFASLACEVLAMWLHSSRQIGDITALKEVVPSLAYLQDNALELPSYNVSLHSNLKQNIEEHFPGVSLANLKKTTLYPEAFGGNFFYDLELGQQLLGFDSKWSGPKEGTGFASEVEKANYNLGLVESQVQLLHSWKLLAVELSQVVSKDERLAKILIGLVKACMAANAQSSLPEVLFGQLMILRADLAFALVRKLVEAKTQVPEARQLLRPVWNAIRASTPDFDTVFSGVEAQYYRSLLRILYLSLQFHLLEESEGNSKEATFRSSFRGTLPTDINTYVEPISSQLLEILADTVAKGFRSLANQLHTDPESVSPSDFALLTALLQRIIAIPEMSKWQTQAALLFSNNNTIRYATSLFSWSDKLSVSRGSVDDPVYGELSLLFVLSLSSIEALAETMAVEGILSQLNTANIMNFYRRPGGMGPFDSPTRLYSIWTKGILPLCLNLLLSVGPPIAAEIASFLNQFQPQLLRASNALNSNPATTLRNPTKITLSAASETHSLALISAILEDVRKQGPKLGIQASEIPILEWDRENVKEDIEGWMARKGALKERIIVADEKDAELFAKKKRGDGLIDNELEERVLFELEAAGICLGLGKAEAK